MELRRSLQDRLLAAMRARDPRAVSVLRSALAAIDNAEAVPPTDEDLRATAIAESPRGLGAAEVPRRALTDADIQAIVRREVSEREQAATVYARAGRQQETERLLEEASILSQAAGFPRTPHEGC